MNNITKTEIQCVFKNHKNVVELLKLHANKIAVNIIYPSENTDYLKFIIIVCDRLFTFKNVNYSSYTELLKGKNKKEDISSCEFQKKNILEEYYNFIIINSNYGAGGKVSEESLLEVLNDCKSVELLKMDNPLKTIRFSNTFSLYKTICNDDGVNKIDTLFYISTLNTDVPDWEKIVSVLQHDGFITLQYYSEGNYIVKIGDNYIDKFPLSSLKGKMYPNDITLYVKDPNPQNFMEDAFHKSKNVGYLKTMVKKALIC